MGARMSRGVGKVPKETPKAPTAPKQKLPEYVPGEGIRSLDTSAGFRTLNFELYVKANKPIMAFGIATMSIITLYFAYMKATTENKTLDAEYDKLYGEGAANYMRTRKVNSWD
ncbi:Oidioi.mRNA.OKI2018_I69.chr1.g3461.t1.cds [Oikopleura dioica]|uniref:Small integral membrane protein 8 n=1 Tax=Oikopleura dioica TaxID=34765 RepID=A0ABN7T3C7_OIKDI|nr:Oidioi.mRNA.OKI2018_I69.chr1.g3461.t1.cds [Oikopleura dioica]